MPNKTVIFTKDAIGKAQILCAWDRAHPPYIGEHVDAECSWETDDGLIGIATTGVVEQMSQEAQTCLVRPTTEANAEVIKAAGVVDEVAYMRNSGLVELIEAERATPENNKERKTKSYKVEEEGNA